MDFRFTTSELAHLLNGRLEGDGQRVLTGLAAIDKAGPDDVTYVVDTRRAQLLADSKAGAAIVANGTDAPAPTAASAGSAIPIIRVANVDAAIAALLNVLGEVEDLPPVGIDARAAIDPSAQIGSGVRIGPFVYVGPGASIGSGSTLCPHVSVNKDAVVGEQTILFAGTVIEARCRVGNSCRIGPSAMIGSSGFGYYVADGRHQRLVHPGNVEIEDHVDIGANTCIDRAKIGATRIGQGTKIDNLVQIAHNVQIGRHCIIVGQVGIAGSTVLKDYVVLGGHAGLRDNITIGTGVRCGAFAAVAQDVADGMEVIGIPATEASQAKRVIFLTQKLPELHQNLRQLEKRVKALESPKDNPEAR